MDAMGWLTPQKLLLVAAVANVVAWAAYRLDKAAATANRRRIEERVLLMLTVPGGVGALLGMYAARRRHKTRKWTFVGAAFLAAAAQLIGLGYALTILLR
jgi:uncharacterized membrane protein YsdA (DUF1294 family)